MAAGFLLRFSFAQTPGELPEELKGVLERHAVDPTGLRQWGLALETGRILRLSPEGANLEPALDAVELEAWILSRKPPAAPRGGIHPRVLARMDKTLDFAPRALAVLYDGAAAAGLGVVAVPDPGLAWRESAFDESWLPVAEDLWNRKTARRGLKNLSERMAREENAETGLSADSPEALRLLTSALHDGKGGPEAPAVLRRKLALVAALTPEQKRAFTAKLSSPLIFYVALSRSRAPHALDARLYFERMETLLGEAGRSLTDFINEVDARGDHAAEFLLRAHAYDALIPYFSRRPQEAAAIVPMLFHEDRLRDIRGHAVQLEGLMVQLAARGRSPAALEAFLHGLRDHAASASKAATRRMAVYLKVNQDILPKRYRPLIADMDRYIPPDFLDEAGLTPGNPRERWPSDQWTFVLHFASTESYRSFLARFASRGYQTESSPDGAAVSKMFGGLKVTLTARLYPGDKEGFLRGEQSRKFLKDVERTLRDPSIQGVILRNHAQFRIVNLFGKGVTPGKLLIDGACRSAWDLAALRRRCGTCRFIVNTGTGYGRLNNDAVIAVIEGMARGDDWDEIGENWSRYSPRSAARMQGPWTPPYEEALKILEDQEKKGIWIQDAGS